MRILDLFSGAGGAAVGYQHAGFEVYGVDIADQPNYPFDFMQADALLFVQSARLMEGFEAVHASPPCQGYSTVTAVKDGHERLIAATRTALEATGKPYIIENVEGAAKELRDPVRLCGSAFGMDLRRHRYFETNWPCVGVPCNHDWQTRRFRSLEIARHRRGEKASVVGVHGKINYAGEAPIRRRAMGIDWMTDEELVESIPPPFTEFIGRQLRAHLRAAAGYPAEGAT